MRWYKETIVSWVMLLFPLLVLGCPESLPENTEFKCPCTDGWTCMDNVCRKYCESYSHCPEGQYCHEQGHCLPWEEVDPDCQPKCEGMECGNDGCGGSCGQCLEGDTCVSGQCQEGECIPDCGGNECGEDGCGSSCGICTNGSICSVDGLCVESPLQPVVLIATHPGWKEATCLDCHMADGHNEGLNPYLCVDCHGANGAPAGHSNSEACNGCHGDKHSPQGFPDPVSCVTCHPTR